MKANMSRLLKASVASLMLAGVTACGGGGGSSSSSAGQGVTTPPTPVSPPATPTPTPTPVTSTNARESLVGLDVNLTILSASSFTLSDSQFATSGDVTRSFQNTTDMFARTVADNASEYEASYSYASIDANSARETTTLPDGTRYETTYSFTSDNAGTWTESFDLGEVTSEGTFTIRPTPVVTDSNGRISLNQSFDGLTRTQIVHLPPNFSPDENLPMMLLLHGAGGRSTGILGFSDFEDVADKERIIVIAPQSSGSTWNSDINNGNDDVGFLGNVIDNAIATYGADEDRVFSAGFSNGAFMTGTLSCDIGNRLAGAGFVAGHLIGRPSSCLRQNRIPSIFFAGDADTVVPISGSGLYGPVADTISLFASEQGCSQTQTSEPVPDISMTDGSTVVRNVQEGCPADTAIEYYLIQGGVHSWPGGTRDFIPSSITPNEDISASEVIWEFFSRF